MRFDKRSVVKVGDVVEFLDEDREGNYYSKQGELYIVEKIDTSGSVIIKAKPLNNSLLTIECFLDRFGRGPTTTIDDWV